MLQRTEIGTREHILTWLASQPEDKNYEWSSDACAASQYMAEHGLLDDHGVGIRELNHLAHGVTTFGALYNRACNTW